MKVLATIAITLILIGQGCVPNDTTGLFNTQEFNEHSDSSNDLYPSPPPLKTNTNVESLKTQPTSSCDPNYSGCVPIASDVDCADGSGDGPAYVRGPIRVIGHDKYGLDRDNDGWACE